jgi:hypothetical protein
MFRRHCPGWRRVREHRQKSILANCYVAVDEDGEALQADGVEVRGTAPPEERCSDRAEGERAPLANQATILTRTEKRLSRRPQHRMSTTHVQRRAW